MAHVLALPLSKVAIHASLTFDALHVLLLDQDLKLLFYLGDIHREAILDLVDDLSDELGMLDGLLGLENTHCRRLKDKLSIEKHPLLGRLLLFGRLLHLDLVDANAVTVVLKVVIKREMVIIVDFLALRMFAKHAGGDQTTRETLQGPLELLVVESSMGADVGVAQLLTRLERVEEHEDDRLEGAYVELLNARFFEFRRHGQRTERVLPMQATPTVAILVEGRKPFGCGGKLDRQSHVNVGIRGPMRLR